MSSIPLLVLLSVTAAGERLTLDRALALAAKRNADLLLAGADKEAAAVELRGSYQGLLPRLDLSASFGHQYEGAQQQVTVVPNTSPPPDFVRALTTYPENDFAQYVLGVNLNWTFFDGLASWRRIDASRSRSDAARRQLDEASLRIAFEVTRRFYEVVRAQRVLEVRRQAAELSEELVKRADALFAAGRGTKADTYSARVNLGSDRLAARSQGSAVTRAQSDLAVVLGLPPDAGLEVEPPETLVGGRPPEQEIPSLAELMARALKRRPLLASLKLSVEAADLDIGQAQGAYWPTLSLQASYQKQTPVFGGTFGLFGNLSNQSVALVQLSIGLNVFAGGETRAGVERAEVAAQRARVRLEQAEETVSAEVTEARDQVATLTDALSLAQENLTTAEQGLRFARERLEAGVGSQLETRDAALKMAQARLDLASTVVDLVVARADLNRSVGGAL